MAGAAGVENSEPLRVGVVELDRPPNILGVAKIIKN